MEPAGAPAYTPPTMSAPMTPEHLQLLSDRRLQETIERAPTGDGDTDARDRALVRMARYEIRRRRCEVPVTDRYACV